MYSCHGLSLSCLTCNRASPSVRCDYSSYTSAVYSHSCISTVCSFTQYNRSSILQFFLHTRCFPHRDSYEPGCNPGLFSSATVTSLYTRRTLLYRVHHNAPVTASTTTHLLPRPPQRTCYRVHHNAPVTAFTHDAHYLDLCLDPFIHDYSFNNGY
jgi:hypothetical protein